MCLGNRQMLRSWGVCVWVCPSSSASEIMNVMTHTSQQCIAVGSERSQGYSRYESFITRRNRKGEERVLRKQQLQYSPSWISLYTTVSVCANIWWHTNIFLPSPSQFQLNYQSNSWPITSNLLIEAVWMLLALSWSDSWASANEMILILCTEHVLCVCVVNWMMICTVHTSLHAYSRWFVEVWLKERERERCVDAAVYPSL